MPKESVHRKLERVRPPRVNITYEVETGGAIEVKELPFVMGVLADFSGQPADELPKLKDRKFTEVSLENFDDVLASMKPHLTFSVNNKLSDDPTAGKIQVDLNFESLDDFPVGFGRLVIGILHQVQQMPIQAACRFARLLLPAE